ncbi:WD40-repeat-containing domain protein [Dimargaris cristalligena]|uniref:WD40-repeat-containing domain protein n=1 Tax=Dimargaris cristalligena TaxID=215637 RepID=A0A4P9ZXP6_9FUNG|nr:WD40-repeat-containing domain protein [Dimargaris cristalligena]|eukprot:RKP38433.1 WD40-repeat-containing domain protein [Dimargaris cristalligena]
MGQPDSSAVVLVTGGFDHCIKFWDAQHGTCIRTIPFAESHINRLCISPDKRFVVAVGSQNAKVFEVAGMNQNPCLLIENHKPGGNIMVAEFQREMKWIVLASEDGVIRIHDFPKTNNLRRTIENKSAINDLKIHPEQDMLITIDQKGFLKLINLRDNSIECQVQPEEGVPLRSVAVARDCSLLVVTNNKGRCFLYHWPEPRQRSRLELLTQIDAHTKYAIRCCLSRNLQYLATCSADTSAKIWKLDGPNVELVHVLMGHEGWVWDLAFSDDSEYLVTAASDQKLRVWKVSSGELSRTIEGHNKAIMSVALNDSVAMRK